MYDDIIKSCANEYCLDERVIRAVISIESDWRIYAARYEPGYLWTYEVKRMSEIVGCTTETMKIMQKTSYGLMQVMGAVYLEYADKEGEVTSPLCLVTPALGIRYGCMHLASKANTYTNPLDLYAAYNAGSVRKVDGKYVNQRAVSKFEKAYKNLGGDI